VRKISAVVALGIAAVPVTAYTWPHLYFPNDLECVGENFCKHQPKIIEGSSVDSTAAFTPAILGGVRY